MAKPENSCRYDNLVASGMPEIRLGEQLDWSRIAKRDRGRLPHWEVPGMTVFVTFRMADALPQSAIAKYQEKRAEVKRRLVQTPDDIELRKEAARLFTATIDRVLDGGQGCCYLRKPHAAPKALATLRHFDGERYTLHAATIMPNHVHVVVTLAPDQTLKSTYHSWKSYLAHEFAKDADAPAPFWQAECYDHIVRDWRELFALTRYTLENPLHAGLRNWPHVFDSGEVQRIRTLFSTP